MPLSSPDGTGLDGTELARGLKARPAALKGSDLTACRRLLRHGSRTFHAASLLLPKRVRVPASGLYAFCRVADDQIDLDDSDGAVEDLRRRIDALYDGRPDPLLPDRALAEVVARFPIPKAVPLALIEGFAWDRDGRRYADIAALRAYGARVAGTVGVMMAVLMGARSAGAIARACDLGTAMQLTNIARDVGEDARAGRLYLPLDWMNEAGIEPDAWLADPRFSPALAGVVERLLVEADRLYDRAAAGIAVLPADCRPAIQAARFLYRGIGHELRWRGHDAVSRRSVVPPKRKRLLVFQAVAASLLPRPDSRALAAAPLAESRFLVEAVAGSVMSGDHMPNRKLRGLRLLDANIGRMLELMQKADEYRQARTQAE